MRERRGAIGRSLGAIADIASSARGGRQGGEARVVIYDAAGHSNRLRPGTPEHDGVLEAGQDILALVAEGRPKPSKRAPDSDPGA